MQEATAVPIDPRRSHIPSVGSALVAATILLLTTSPGNATGAVDERSAEVCWYEPTTMVGTPGP